MSLSYQLKNDTIFITVVGEVNFNTGFKVFQESIKSAKLSNFKTKWDILFDLSLSTENRTSTELQGIAEFIGANMDILSGKSAVVVSDKFHHALSRIFATFLTDYGVKMEIFENTEHARSWLKEQMH